ncbi:DUF937 domain-containing protein [Aureliella helgolandensis]|uniref:DUF937 domain-containing protein n=1 Tax=Aureliella helgolandensis TaxID=2527968 RepID=A0A518G5C4_9BACT|nr:DUF937 domain-containing protein [Aureliella helgolandensis]QDV23793.1 hypothetical protein Q31a_20980 [Aureliella helgolandensis]
MSSLMDLVSKQIGREQVDQIASQLGSSREQVESAIGMALPTLLGAVARKADDAGQSAELHSSLQHHDDGILDQTGQLFGGQPAPALQSFGGVGDLLGSMLGGRQGRVEQGIGKASGMSGTQVASLLAMLAPLVMGAISRQAKTDKLDSDGLSGMLRGEKKEIENQATGGLLAGLLDQDGDGDFDFQDVMKLGMKRLFGK